ncbi:METALLO-BETA-LACTAMASE FAMILY PROTEIN [Salix viminalis]|uniref:METALLO-BETA-LACTAMASE FAMILY PROTEIN n=1 Tax=Salix viminalis TaxID=40686 RepID=A0A9Q0Z4A0_SALVM|nr:METALLO-BETA-LACTAMASE FAMILY PROTEIN [Salix viminalis]
MAVKITADLRYPEVGLPSSLFSGQRRLNAKSKGGKVSVIRAIQSQEEAAAAAPTSIQYQARRIRRPQNIEGDFFVDHTCIDCDTCRWMAPQVFTRIGEMSAVFKQPTSGEERLKALQALLSCPTSSIHTEKPASDILQVQKTFPSPIDQQRIPGVYHCGYHSEKSYGAASFLIVHPEGNIIIDSPRYTERLARNIEMLGGARYMFLTHEDDVADHRRWSERLSCDRVLHSGDVDNSTADVETKLQGTGPWNLGKDVQLIHTPGHTEGSVCLFYKPLKILFTGDHLLMTETGLSICERYNKCSVQMQVDSVLKLLEIDFNWIIPGHGRRVEFKDREEKDSILKAFVEEKYSQYS